MEVYCSGVWVRVQQPQLENEHSKTGRAPQLEQPGGTVEFWARLETSLRMKRGQQRFVVNPLSAADEAPSRFWSPFASQSTNHQQKTNWNYSVKKAESVAGPAGIGPAAATWRKTAGAFWRLLHARNIIDENPV